MLQTEPFRPVVSLRMKAYNGSDQSTVNGMSLQPHHLLPANPDQHVILVAGDVRFFVGEGGSPPSSLNHAVCVFAFGDAN